MPITAEPEARARTVLLDKSFGWRRHRASGGAVWFKGYVFGDDPASLARSLAAQTADDALAVIAELDGHFGLVVETPRWTVAAVDRIASVPIFYVENDKEVAIDGIARRLIQHFALAEIDRDATLEIAMSGYTIGPRTMVRGLETLAPGDAIIFNGNSFKKRSYFRYRPRARNVSSERFCDDLASLSLAVLEKATIDANGRPILVPLSAGLDLRLVASGLRRLGYRNVRCFSYGRSGNFEAQAARKIADRLGYRWTFVPFSAAQQRDTFSSKACADFIGVADTCMSVPFQQDFYAVQRLKASGYAPSEAIFINGRSGRLSFGWTYSLCALRVIPFNRTDDDRWMRITDAIIEKHHSLWAYLKNADNLSYIRRALRGDFAAVGISLSPNVEEDYSLFEASDIRNRQSKYVVSGQRTYEYFDYEWRLPLWDRDYIDFWASAPLWAKRKQSAYRAFLKRENWGGVWGPDWAFPKFVSPAPLRAARAVLKLMHAPLGRSRWHDLERRFLRL